MDDSEICLSFLVRQAWLNMRSAVDDALAPHGLSVAQYATLLVLDEQPGASIADVARVVASTRQSANELLAGMERAGLVERRPHSRDRRTQELNLTALGRQRLKAAKPSVHAREGELEAALDARERAAARTWLAHMARAGHLP
ncbi:MarR family winged helix-turn-helix transcriptional regulator [Actinoplanes aureus]|uniref:MarR family transcriptional regulator n=1 Tax=Actinoplanes aureus TaxID=2792083 RepID=A0A931G1G2_9ACTN|nr:MarR family transcriptional regulator [Actinoplanes aureus]MBG0566985.1 MarR family transcriptional regulator [Actinoplanes aureus]